MSKPIVRCRCGHQVLGREVLRTQPCEKPSGVEAVYVKYRCRRCKKIGEAFVPADEWSTDIFDVPRGEIGAIERDNFIGADALSSGDVISFHQALQKANTVSELFAPAPADASNPADAPANVAPKPEARRVTDARAAKDATQNERRDGDKRDADKSSGDKPRGDKPPHRSRGGN